jgi:hypothetical protein
MTKTDYQETAEDKNSLERLLFMLSYRAAPCFFFSLFRPWLVPAVANSWQKFPEAEWEEKFCRRKKVQI